MTNSRSVSVVVFAIVASVLLATTPTAVTADADLVVGSQHDTATELQNAQTLTNLTVEGSGAAGSVVLSDGSITAGGVSRYPFEDKVSDVWASNDGTDFTSAGYVSGKVGSSAKAFDASSNDYVNVGDKASLKSGGLGDSFTLAVWVKPDSESLGSNKHAIAGVASGSEEDIYWVRTYNGHFEAYLDVTGNQNTGDSNFLESTTQPTAGEWYHVASVYNGSAWTLYVNGEAQDSVSVSGDLSSTAAPFSIGSRGGDTWYWDGAVDDLRVYDRGLASPEVEDLADNTPEPDSGQYVSSTHQVSNAEEAAINITQISNVSVDAEVRTDDGTTLATDTITTAGNHTLTLANTSSNQLEVVLDVSVTGSNPQFTLADESILFDAQAPSGSLESPEDGAELTESSIDFSVDVADADFGTAQGDEVTATLQLRGPGESSWSDYGSDTTTSNSTVTVSEQITTGGEWQYRFRLEDSYGESATTAARSVLVPAELEVRSALPPHELINDVNLTVRFYEDSGEERVFQQNPTDGTISLSGLPTTDFVVTVRANESYAYRRIVLDSLYEQSTVYLLPDNATSSQIVFQLDDRTGRFDAAQTTLYIEAPITRDFNGDGNETTEYVTIAGDTFGGSEQFPVTLENNQRYRLRVENENGETRVLGSYTTAGDAVAVLPLGQVVIDSEVGEGGVAFDAAIREAEDGSRYIRVVYRDPEMATQSLSLEVTNPDTGTTIRANSTMQGPYGRYIETVPLPASANDSQTYLIDWNAERNASVVGGQERVGNVNAFVGDIDVDPAIRGLIGYGAIIGLTGLVIIRSPRVAGVVGVGTAVVVSALGVVSIAPSALGIGGAIAVLAFVGGGGR